MALMGRDRGHPLSRPIDVLPATTHSLEQAMQSTTVRSRHHSRNFSAPALACALGTCLLTGSISANAFVFCVSTAAELQGALTQSSTNGTHDGESNTIFITTGTYNTGAATNNGPFYYHSASATGGLQIIGGYASGCFPQTRDARLTVLDGGNATAVLELHNAVHDVEVGFLTIQNGESGSVGAGLSMNPISGDNGQTIIYNNIIRNNHSTVGAGGLFAHSTTSDIPFLYNNLIVGNSADQGFGAGEFGASGTGGAGVYNNTVTQNSTSLSGGSGGLDFYCSGPALCSVANNIFFNNNGSGLYLATSVSTLDYNDYGTLGGFPALNGSGNVSVNPQFVNAANNNFHLSGTSPLLAISPVHTHHDDVEGHTYPSTGKGDLGAYAETMFTDGFDGN
jgi:hypothetical protein